MNLPKATDLKIKINEARQKIQQEHTQSLINELPQELKDKITAAIIDRSNKLYNDYTIIVPKDDPFKNNVISWLQSLEYKVRLDNIKPSLYDWGFKENYSLYISWE